MKRESAVSPAMYELCARGTAERQPAQNKGASVEGKLLPTIRPLFADEADRFDLRQLVFGQTDGGKNPLQGAGASGAGFWTAAF